jgi:threonine synthase
MRTTDSFVGLDCVDCGERHDPAAATGRCPDCGGILDPAYDYDAVDVSREAIESRRFDTLWRYGDLLPFHREHAVTLDEGATPLVEAPALAERMGVGRVLVKDEGRNPTGTFKDRGATGAVTAAREHGATDVALNSAGNAGQAAAAYAAAAGMEAHVFLPTRAGNPPEAMVQAHGADLTVVDGEIDDAGAAYAEATAEHDWHSVKTFVTPYRHETKKTMFYEIAEQLGWEAPDAIVYPTGGGVGLVGMHKGAVEFRDLGLTEALPAMYAAQSSGCAPIVRAWEAGAEESEPWTDIDTAFGGIAVPNPGASALVLEAIAESGGGAVATDDERILDAAVEVASTTGVEMGGTCAAAASGAFELAERGAFDDDDTVVVLNTGAGNKEDDLIGRYLDREG